MKLIALSLLLFHWTLLAMWAIRKMSAFSNCDCYSIRGPCQIGHHSICYLKFLNICTPLENDIPLCLPYLVQWPVIRAASLVPDSEIHHCSNISVASSQVAYTFDKGCTYGLLHVLSLIASWYAFSYSSALDTGREIFLQSWARGLFHSASLTFGSTYTLLLWHITSKSSITCAGFCANGARHFGRQCLRAWIVSCLLNLHCWLRSWCFLLLSTKLLVRNAAVAAAFWWGKKMPIYWDLCTVKFYPR